MIRTVLNPFCLISILLIAVCLNLSNAQNEDLPKFTNVQTETGMQSVGGMGQSATWGDYNVDGWPDIFLSNRDHNIRGKRRRSLRGNSGSINSSIDQYQIQTSFLFLNEEGQFKEVSRYLGIPNSHYINATWADYDNDGFLDLALGTISSAAPLKLYKNMDSVYFIDVSADAGIIKESVVTHGIWADYDNDGNVDLFQVSTGVSFLYKNKGNGTFEEISERAGLGELLSTNSALWFDSNNDGYQDLLLLNSGMNIMYLNNRDGTFLDITESSGLGGRQLWKTTSACSGDYNGDGYFDIYLTNIGRASGNALYRNNGDGTFTNITWNTNTDDVGDGRTCAWIDFDADGKIDLFSTNHVNPNRLYRNIGNDVFVDVASLVGIDYPMDVFAASWGDYNRDGFVDVFLNGHLGTALMKNSGNANNSVTLNLIGSGLLSNSSAIGARVEVISAEGIQVREVSGGRGCCEQDMLPVYFGVGQDKTIGVNVKWPSGRTCSFKELSLEKVNHFTIHEIKCDIIPSNKIAN